jgi:hypothetical protein
VRRRPPGAWPTSSRGRTRCAQSISCASPGCRHVPYPAPPASACRNRHVDVPCVTLEDRPRGLGRRALRRA